MKSVITILLAALFTVNQTPLVQLFKLPAFVEHYNKHQQHEQLTLHEFLKEHYASNHNDDDKSEDNKLPFKTIVLNDIGNAVVHDSVNNDFILSYKYSVNQVMRKIYLPAQYNGSIFHPPKV